MSKLFGPTMHHALVNPWHDTWHVRRRITRGEYWLSMLVYGLVAILMTKLAAAFVPHVLLIGVLLSLGAMLFWYMLILLTVHRFRDVGITGWAVLGILLVGDLFAVLGILGWILDAIFMIGVAIILCGDSGVMPDGAWSPEYDQDK